MSLSRNLTFKSLLMLRMMAVCLRVCKAKHPEGLYFSGKHFYKKSLLIFPDGSLPLMTSSAIALAVPGALQIP